MLAFPCALRQAQNPVSAFTLTHRSHPSEKLVEITVNGKQIDVPMKMGDAGEAFFVVSTDEQVPSEFATSPIQKPQHGEEQMDSFLLDEEISKNIHAPDSQSLVSITQIVDRIDQVNLSDNSGTYAFNADITIESHASLSIEPVISRQTAAPEPVDIPSRSTNHHLDGNAPTSVESNTKLGTSPPAYYSWSWGGFPETQKEPKDNWDKVSMAGSERPRVSSESPDNRGITHFTSTPALKQAYHRGEGMTSAEKVDQYLAGLSQVPQTQTVIPINSSAAPVTHNEEFRDPAMHPLLEISIWYLMLCNNDD